MHRESMCDWCVCVCVIVACVSVFGLAFYRSRTHNPLPPPPPSSAQTSSLPAINSKPPGKPCLTSSITLTFYTHTHTHTRKYVQISSLIHLYRPIKLNTAGVRLCPCHTNYTLCGQLSLTKKVPSRQTEWIILGPQTWHFLHILS